jgi:hypothetical protein
MSFQWPEPAWLSQVAPERKAEAMLRFHLKLAAIYSNEAGSILDLSESLDLHPKALSNCKSRAKIDSSTALKLEQSLGDYLFPWQMFLPAIAQEA